MSGPRTEWLGWETPALAEALFQHADDALLVVESHSERILEANSRATELTQFQHDELLGIPLRSLLRHEQGWQDWIAPATGGAPPLRDGFLLRTRQPEVWIPVAVRLSQLPLPDSGLPVLIALYDRRDQVESVRRAQRAEAELRRIVIGVSDCLWSCRVEADGRWHYRYLAPLVQRLTGRPVGWFLENPDVWRQLVEPDDVPAWQQFRQRLQDGYSNALEYRLRRPDGSRVWVHESVVVTPDEGWLLLNGIITDISERKKGEVAPPPSPQERLDAVAKLAGALSHDFNNLITGVLGHISLLRLSGMGREGLDQIEAITLRAADLCKQLATIAGRNRSGGQIHELGNVVRHTLALLERDLPGHSRLRVEIAEHLPGALLDEGQLRLLLDALVRNAAEAMEESPGEIVVRLNAVGASDISEILPCFSHGTTSLPPPALCLEIRDTGPGLAADVRARLGEPFVTTKGEKRGLGLATVLGIVRAQQGGITIRSREAQGTVVRLFLPGVSSATVQAVVPSALAANQAEGVQRASLILLADDEETVLDVAVRLLRSTGCEVISARNGEEALACFRERGEDIQLAFVDLTMPKLSGEKTLRELRKLAPALPLVLMSGYPETDVMPRFSDLELAGYLQKPFRLPAVLDLLRRLLPQ